MKKIFKPMSERITQQEFDETFADLKALPSYLKIAQNNNHQPAPGFCDWYHDSVELAQEQIWNSNRTIQK